MNRLGNPLLIKRGILLFWTLWLALVFCTNLLDGLKALLVLPETWPFASGNYSFMVKVVDRYNPPAWLAVFLFIGVVCWEGLATLLFGLAYWKFKARDEAALVFVHAAFAVGLALWAAFMLADEIFMVYDVENTHRGLFTAQLVSLLAVRLLP